MIVRRSLCYSIRASFVIVLCFGNWILCAPGGSHHSGNHSERVDITETEPLTELKRSHSTEVKLPRQNRKSLSRPSKNSTEDNAPESQNFFQSFAPLFGNNSPLGHSRPLLYPEHSFKPAFKTASYRDVPFSGASDNILGSGNFGVVKGGTYYAEERDDADFTSENEPYTYLGSSTHGRVHKKNPPPAFRNGGDFFAHFRDFADITAPSKSYSQYYVVYVNKNATVEDSARPKQPKNIIEQLTMLDSTSEEPLKANESTKQSKFKRKLAAHQSRDSEKEKSIKMKLHDPPKEIAEPLLALS